MKKTEWFPCTVNPVRHGRYELKYSYMPNTVMAIFDKRGWTYNSEDANVWKFVDKWRGLASKDGK